LNRPKLIWNKIETRPLEVRPNTPPPRKLELWVVRSDSARVLNGCLEKSCQIICTTCYFHKNVSVNHRRSGMPSNKNQKGFQTTNTCSYCHHLESMSMPIECTKYVVDIYNVRIDV
jgi:hypothetical protein